MKSVESPERHLSTRFGLTASQLDRVLHAAINGRAEQGAYCDVYLQAGSEQGLVFDQGTLKSTSFKVVNGAGVRVVIGDKTGYSYTDHVNFTNLRKAAVIARAIADHSKGAESITQPADASKAHDLYTIGQSPVLVDLQAKLDILRKIDAAARAVDPRIENVTVSLAVEEYDIVIANSLGHVIFDKRPLLRVSVSCLAVDGNRRENGSSGGGGRAEFSFLLENELWKKHAEIAAKQAITLLSSVPA